MNETTMSATSNSITPLALIPYAIIIIIMIVETWKLFEKAGIHGWSALIPFYNTYCFFKMTWGNGWMFLLSFVPIVNIVIVIMTMNKLAKSFGKGVGFTFGLIFFSIIFEGILAFGSSEYSGVPQ